MLEPLETTNIALGIHEAPHSRSHTMPPNLEHRFALRAYLSKDNICDLQAIRSGPRNYIAAITGGFLKGEGLDAELLPGGADWMSVRHVTVLM